MKHTILINHDGHTFFVNPEAMERGYELIGFYFDALGLPQQILNNSIYGGVIRLKLKTNLMGK